MVFVGEYSIFMAHHVHSHRIRVFSCHMNHYPHMDPRGYHYFFHCIYILHNGFEMRSKLGQLRLNNDDGSSKMGHCVEISSHLSGMAINSWQPMGVLWWRHVGYYIWPSTGANPMRVRPISDSCPIYRF